MFRHPFYTLISSFVISLISSGSLVESYVCGDSSQVANNPVIGILSMERFQNRQATTDSYIAASYVKFIESAGAQVVPLPLGKSDQYYSRLFYKLNGVLFPGGGVYFNQSDYTRVAHIFLTKALARNRSMLKKSKTKETKQFPVWGTCLGMEVIVYLMFNQTDSMFQCNHQDRQGSLQFELPENKLRSQTLLFRDASPSDINVRYETHLKRFFLRIFDFNYNHTVVFLVCNS